MTVARPRGPSARMARETRPFLLGSPRWLNQGIYLKLDRDPQSQLSHTYCIPTIHIYHISVMKPYWARWPQGSACQEDAVPRGVHQLGLALRVLSPEPWLLKGWHTRLLGKAWETSSNTHTHTNEYINM